MKRTSVLFVILALLASVAGAADAKTCKPEEQIRLYLKENYPKTSLNVLVFDHRDGSWQAYRWDPSKNVEASQLEDVERGKGFDFDFNGKPTFTLDPDDQMVVLVADTNPMLYTLEPIEATETDIEDLAQIQQLASAIGSIALGVIGTEFQPRATGQAFTEMLEGRLTARSFAILQEPTPMSDQEAEEAVEQASEDLVLQARRLTAAIQRAAEPVQTSVNNLSAAATRLGARVAEVEVAASSIRAYVQDLELGNVSTSLLDPRLADLSGRVEQDFSTLLDRRNALVRSLPCTGGLQALSELIRLTVTPLPSGPIEQDRALQDFDRLLDELATMDLSTQGCSEMVDPIRFLREFLASRRPRPNVPPSPADVIVLTPLRQRVIAPYLETASRIKTADEKAGELLKRRGEVGKMAASFHIALRRQSEHLLPRGSENKDICSLITGVLEVERPNGTEFDVPWHKIRTEGFNLKVDPQYKDSVLSLRTTEQEQKYDLRRANRLRFGIDFGPVVTDRVNPIWEAAPAPAGAVAAVASEGEDDTEPAEPPKYITRTDEESRSGKLAMFANFEPFHWRDDTLGLGFQVGAAVDDDPALFLGLTFGWGRYVRIGGGWTRQQVKELDDRQEESRIINGEFRPGTQVADTASIRTRNDWTDGWYVTLTLSIDELPIFQPAAEEEEE